MTPTLVLHDDTGSPEGWLIVNDTCELIYVTGAAEPHVRSPVDASSHEVVPIDEAKRRWPHLSAQIENAVGNCWRLTPAEVRSIVNGAFCPLSVGIADSNNWDQTIAIKIRDADRNLVWEVVRRPIGVLLHRKQLEAFILAQRYAIRRRGYKLADWSMPIIGARE